MSLRIQIPRTLSIALANIIDNAIKYTPLGGTIRITVYSSHNNGHIDIADSGPGIPLQFREKIFDRFYRIEQGRSNETGGDRAGAFHSPQRD